jgi:glucokinase
MDREPTHQQISYPTGRPLLRFFLSFLSSRRRVAVAVAVAVAVDKSLTAVEWVMRQQKAKRELRITMSISWKQWPSPS